MNIKTIRVVWDVSRFEISPNYPLQLLLIIKKSHLISLLFKYSEILFQLDDFNSIEGKHHALSIYQFSMYPGIADIR